MALEAAAARKRVEILLSAALTETDLLQLQAKIAELKEIVVAVRADQGSLGQEMTLLRGRKADLDLTGMKQSFDAAIAIQDKRIDLVTQSIETVKGICPD